MLIRITSFSGLVVSAVLMSSQTALAFDPDWFPRFSTRTFDASGQLLHESVVNIPGFRTSVHPETYPTRSYLLPKLKTWIESARNPRSARLTREDNMSVSFVDETYNGFYQSMRVTSDNQAAFENTREQVTREAENASFSLKAATEESRAANADVYKSLGSFLPKLSGSLYLDGNRETAEQKNNSNTVENHFRENKAGVSLSMPVFNGGKNIYSLKRSRSIAQAARQRYRATRSQVNMDAVIAWFGLLRDQKIEISLDEAVRSSRKILHITRQRYKGGESSKTDISLAEAQLASLEAEFFAAVSRRQSSETSLQSMLAGRPVTYIRPKSENRSLPFGLHEAKRLVLTRNPALLASIYNADAERYAIRQAEADALPRVSLTGDYQTGSRFGSFNDRQQEARIGLQVDISLFNPEVLANVKASRHRARASYYTALDTRRQILKQFETDWNDYHVSKKQKNALDAQIRALDNALLSTTEEYQAGLRDLTDVFSAQVDKVRAAMSKEQTSFHLHQLYHRIILTTGKGGVPEALVPVFTKARKFAGRKFPVRH